MKTRKRDRLLSLLLSLTMVLGLLPGLSISASAADATYTKYILDISACTSADDNNRDGGVNDAIDFGKSVITCWYLKRGKTPTKYTDEVLGSTGDASSRINNLIFEAGEDSYNIVTFTIYLNEGYQFTDSTKALAFKDASYETKVSRWSCSRVGELNEDGGRTYTYTATSGKWDANSTLFLCIPVEKTGAAGGTEYTVTLYPKPSEDKTIEIKAAENETLPDLSSQLQEFDKDYFSVAEVDAWYTAAPAKQSDGTYLFDDSKKFNADAQITQDLTLYAKPKIKGGVMLPTIVSLPMYEPLLADNLSNNGNLMNWVYTTDKEAAWLPSNPKNMYWQLPIGTAWTENDIPGTGQYSTLITNGNALTNSEGKDFPLPNAEVSGWYYEDLKGEWQEVKAGAQISEEYAQQMLDYGKFELKLYPVAVLTSEVTFNTGEANLSIGPYQVRTTQDKKQGQLGTLSAENIAAIEGAIRQKENTDDFKKLFRGWYASQDFSGKRIYTDNSKIYWLDDSWAVQIVEKTVSFGNNSTLYAKWEDAYTLTYDFGNYTPTNSDLYEVQPIARGDKLTTPTTPLVEGAVFVAWYTTADFQEDTQYDFDTSVTGDITLYAKFDAARQISVTFKYAKAADLNTLVTTATYPNTPIVSGYVFGEIPTLPGKTRTESEGFEFKTVYYDDEGGKRTLTYTGWTFTDKNGQEQTLTEDMVLANYVADDVTSLEIYAKYDMSFQFTFDLDGGKTTKPEEVQEVTINADSGTVTKPNTDPTRDGWDFGGWVDASGNPFDFTKSYNENTTIKASWVTEKEYAVKFKVTPAAAIITVMKQGSDAVITPVSTDQSGNVEYKLTKGVYIWTVSAEGYKTIQETLTIDTNHNEENVIEATLSSFKPVTGITLNLSEIMQKKSYDLSSLAEIVPADASVKTIAWSVKTANDGVTLGADGKTLTVSDAATGSVTLTATVVKGKLNAAGTEEEDYTKDFVLTVAAFRPTVTFTAGTVGPATEDIQNMPEPVLATDSKISAPSPSPSASGWTFDGWYLESGCTTAWTTDHEFTDDAVLYAKWTKNPIPVTVTFVGGEGSTLNTGASGTYEGKSGDRITLPSSMFTKPGYIFRSWGGMFAGAEYTLPEEDVTFTANWTAITEEISEDDITQALKGITEENAASYKPQIDDAVAALAEIVKNEDSALDNQALIENIESLYEAANPTPKVTITGDASDGAGQVGAILSSDGAKHVELKINQVTTTPKSLPAAYQGGDYKAAYRDIQLLVGGASESDPTVPIVITIPIPSELAGMAADTIRMLHYKGNSTMPEVITPIVSENNLTFVMDSFSHVYFVGKEISENADTRVTSLVMKYNGAAMGKVTQDANGNFTVTLPSTTSESMTSDLSSGIGAKWMTYITAADDCSIQEKGSGGIASQTAEFWKNTGVCVQYTIDNGNNWTATRTFTVTAKDGTTTRDFTITVTKITSEAQIYEINTANIVGGTVTASPNPAAADEDIKLTITPDKGMKLSPGSLSYTLQVAGAAPVSIDETTLTFAMPAGNININATFVSDGSGTSAGSPQITSFMVNGVSAAINNESRIITIVLPYGTDLSSVAPVISGNNIKSISPASAQLVNLRSAKTYIVHGTDGTKVTYTVAAYVEEPTPAVQLWESLQDHISSTANWWELAEYQKVTGYYGGTSTTQPLYSLQTYLDDVAAMYGSKRTTLTNYYSGGRLMLEPASYSMSGTSYSNTLEFSRKILSNLSDLGYSIVTYNLRELQVDIYEKMETTKGFKITVSAPSSSIRSAWSKLSGSGRLFEIEASSTKAGLVLRIPVGDVLKSELSLMKYDPTKAKFVELDRDSWYIQDGYLITTSVSAGIYGLRDK